MTIRTALQQGTKLLEEGSIAAPRLTAELLLCHAIQCDRVHLYSHPEQELSEVEWLHFGRYLHQRLQGKPLQYITRRQEFYGREFFVTPQVLIPRPETEHVIETALELARSARRVIDVGCGSGAIAVTLNLETGASVWATDVSWPALAVAAENARRLGARIFCVQCDLMEAVAERSVDLVVSNPPYVPLSEMDSLQREVRDYEPCRALLAGPTGFEFYERLAAESRRVLRPDGWIILELAYQAKDRVASMFEQGWGEVQVRHDLSGIPRVLACRKD